MQGSVLDAVSDAVDHVGKLLFQPFELKTWFVMGFCAWLASLGQGGGGNSLRAATEGAERWPGGVPTELEPAILVAVLFAIGFVLLLVLALLWVSSRGTFMFIDNVVNGVARVAEPWSEYAADGNRLFALRLILGIAVLALIGVPAVTLVIALERGDAFGVAEVTLIAAIVIVGFFAVVASFVVDDFMAPIMFLRRCTVGRAWSEAAATIGANLGNVVVYAILKLALGVAVVLIAMLSTCLTCCLTAIPYIGTVILLPLIAFMRAFGLFFLGRLGPEFDRFRTMGPDVEHVARTFE